jgi:AcrR family transcriptional regulator
MKPFDCAVVGRPREFDVEEALAAALKVFWRKGYDGASLTELTEAMGITRPSLYCAFGNKEALFRKALELYGREKLAYIDCGLNAPTAYEAAERLLMGACEAQTDPETPGCMGVNSVLSCGGVASESVRAALADLHQGIQAKFIARFERAKAEGDLDPDCDPAGLAGFIITLSQGMAVQASTGIGRDALRRVVAMALQAWPCNRMAVA